MTLSYGSLESVMSAGLSEHILMHLAFSQRVAWHRATFFRTPVSSSASSISWNHTVGSDTQL